MLYFSASITVPTSARVRVSTRGVSQRAQYSLNLCSTFKLKEKKKRKCRGLCVMDFMKKEKRNIKKQVKSRGGFQ